MRSWRTQDRSGRKGPKNEPPKSEKEVAKQKLIERIQRRFAEDERNPAVRSQTELVFAEVTVAPDAKPGRREIRVITKRGVSNPLPFYVGQVPEVARKPMKTMPAPGARQGVSGPAQQAAGRRGAAHHGAVHDERPDRRGRGEPVSFSGEQGAASGHLRQGPGVGALRRRRRSRLVPSRAEALATPTARSWRTTTISVSTPTR